MQRHPSLLYQLQCSVIRQLPFTHTDHSLTTGSAGISSYTTSLSVLDKNYQVQGPESSQCKRSLLRQGLTLHGRLVWNLLCNSVGWSWTHRGSLPSAFQLLWWQVWAIIQSPEHHLWVSFCLHHLERPTTEEHSLVKAASSEPLWSVLGRGIHSFAKGISKECYLSDSTPVLRRFPRPFL